MYENLRDIIIFRILTGAATFARSIRVFNVGDGGGSIERLDNGRSFFCKPISCGSPDSFQWTCAVWRIFQSVMNDVLSESGKDETDAARMDLHGFNPYG